MFSNQCLRSRAPKSRGGTQWIVSDWRQSPRPSVLSPVSVKSPLERLWFLGECTKSVQLFKIMLKCILTAESHPSMDVTEIHDLE